MVLSEVEPQLRSMLPSQILRTRTFRIAGMGESDLDSLIAPIYTKYKNPTTTVLAGAGDLTVVLFARSETEEEADALLKEVGDPIAALLGERVYAETDDPLEVIVGNILRDRGETVSTAESCTGGLVATRLTEYSGASDFFNGAFVTYTNDQKERLLGVPHEMLERFTAVSEPVAKAMAEGTRTRTGSTYGVSVTGYAGPSGGTEENPVGTVYVGIATPHKAHAFRFRFGADRTRVRLLSAQTALDLLRRAVLGLELVAWRK
jgi:nicotinamide-nucleotide amidase